MRPSATSNFHLPLSNEVNEVRDMLREEVERSGRPGTAIAREVLSEVAPGTPAEPVAGRDSRLRLGMRRHFSRSRRGPGRGRWEPLGAAESLPVVPNM
jgi:hypothetical protein